MMHFNNKIKKVEKLWGREEIIVNNEMYCGKLLHIKPGFQCSLHYHPVKHETFYILKGIVRIEIESTRTLMKEGQSVIVPPHTKHRFSSMVSSILLEVSTHHDDEDAVKVEEGRQIDDFYAYRRSYL